MLQKIRCQVPKQSYNQSVVTNPATSIETSDSVLLLLFHGDLDTAVPIEQSVTMEAALKKAGVGVKFVRVPGGKHGRNFGFAADDPRLPSYLDTVAQWFVFLRRASVRSRKKYEWADELSQSIASCGNGWSKYLSFQMKR